MIPVVSIVGRSNSGKTTFLEKLIAELKQRGYRIAVIKHSGHDFEIDHPGKDSYRHAQAGADTVVITSAYKMAMVKRFEEEPSAQDVIAMIGPGYDLILTEGYKRGPFPKIEISRKAVSSKLITRESDLVAIVSDNLFALDLPHFALEDALGVANFIEEKYLAVRMSHEYSA